MVQARGTRWRCRIYLVREMGTEGLEEGSSKRIQFGEDINERDAVCDRIQRAQAAILHPDIDPKNFLGSYRKAKESGFSSDSILVEISGPDVIDLSFVDLPGEYFYVFMDLLDLRCACSALGIIAMDNDDSENVGRVERLVSSYVENLSSLVLLVYKCSG
ncbi:hypothetical protein FRC15_003353 [Serendipita sp. 397]|nr:hypothetical protein FRC15_003353 [Serendipita sp. 397]KAG8780495.1 hypothetical protein FRC16_003135 [Serendipita sp. 398]KAG8811523.1 hypothetical protein FRC18_003429 [Serendipita sp. 400]